MSEQIFDIAIIGAGPAGLSAALTARVRNKSVALFEHMDFSPKLQKAHTINNYLGMPNTAGKDMMKQMADHCLSAGPTLLRCGLADLRLALPAALLASTSSVVGALVGLAMSASLVQTALGVTILGIVLIMSLAKTGDRPQSAVQDALSAALKMQGVFRDAASGQEQHWQAQRTFLGLFLFIGIGFLAGLFGMGAGWANVPVLNLVMGAPLKVSAGTSSFILSLVDSSAAWVYLNRGAVLAIIAVPSVVGMMLGAKIGARLLTRLKAASVRRMVIVLLLFTGLRSLLKGLAIWA